MGSLVELNGGTTNHLTLDTQARVVHKQFVEGNAVSRDPAQRVIAEWWSMKMVGFSPQHKGSLPNGISMGFVEGEKHLQDAVDTYPDHVQQMVYRQAGDTLAQIHSVIHAPVTRTYHENHKQKIYSLLQKNTPALIRKGFDPMALLDYFEQSYDPQEVEKKGLVWTHGDYWLNNFIGQRTNNHFQFNGVIDWELAGMGSPYEDFAIVEMSIEREHPESKVPFWKGYGEAPEPTLQRHFSAVKILDWMAADDPMTNGDYSSSWYQEKFALLRETI